MVGHSRGSQHDRFYVDLLDHYPDKLPEFFVSKLDGIAMASALAVDTLAADLRRFADEQSLSPSSSPSPQSKRKKPPKEPSADAIAAYRLSLVVGGTQAAIAEQLAKQWHRPVSQGRVSVMLKQVREWLEAGNILPDLTAPSRHRVVVMGPRQIDLGANQERRAKHQRRRRSSDGN
jgi:hypothetical protein